MTSVQATAFSPAPAMPAAWSGPSPAGQDAADPAPAATASPSAASGPGAVSGGRAAPSPLSDANTYLSALAETPPPIDTRKVQMIQAMIAAGTYPINAHAIAMKMMSLDLGSAPSSSASSSPSSSTPATAAPAPAANA